jgi:hypothetical protein
MIVIIFSKDRPFQLHGALSSFALQACDADQVQVFVLYKASNEFYAKAYELVADELASTLRIHWVPEVRFKADLLNIMRPNLAPGGLRWLLSRISVRQRRPRSEYVLFLVDDTIFVRPFSISEIAYSLAHNPHALAFSLRVGANTTSCYSMKCDQPLPAFDALPYGLSFHWVGAAGDFGYPLEVSSSVYRSLDILPLLRILPYSNPNRLEQVLSASSRGFARRRPSLLCYEQSVAFCAPVNKVQTSFDNRSGQEKEYSAEALNSLFMDGYRLDIKELNGFVPNAAHQEIKLPLTCVDCLT